LGGLDTFGFVSFAGLGFAMRLGYLELLYVAAHDLSQKKLPVLLFFISAGVFSTGLPQVAHSTVIEVDWLL
jgi:hypothetical protein